MQHFQIAVIVFVALMFTGTAVAQDDAEELKIAALEALIAAPAERALPLAAKALRGNNSDDVKERALFVLSQIDLPEAQQILIETATQGSGDIRLEAIRMIGISGERETLAQLRTIFENGDEEVQEAVLEAYLIADDEDAVYELAIGTDDPEVFDMAVEMLGVMGAKEHLRNLRDRAGMSESLIEAYMISDDAEALTEIALDNSDPDLQAEAIEALGVVGGDQANATLLQIYKNATSSEIRESALEGMLISDYDEGVLELYRASDDPAEKRDLLEYLIIMDSDAIYEVIDQALGGDQ